MTLADEIRALLKANGPMTAQAIRLLLPDRRNKDGTPRRTRAREVHSRLHAMCHPGRSLVDGAILTKAPGDLYVWRRDPSPKLTPEQAKESARLVRQRYEARRQEAKKLARRARGIVPIAKRALRVKDYADRQSQNADASQAIRAREMGLRDMPADVRPDTDAWLAANADRYERLPSFGPLAVSPASRFTRLKVEA